MNQKTKKKVKKRYRESETERELGGRKKKKEEERRRRKKKKKKEERRRRKKKKKKEERRRKKKKKKEERRRRKREKGLVRSKERKNIYIKSQKSILAGLHIPAKTGRNKSKQDKILAEVEHEGASYRFACRYEIFRPFWPERNGIYNIGFAPSRK